MTNRYMKKCSRSLITREMQTTPIMKYHLTLVKVVIISQSMMQRTWRKGNLALLVGIQIGVATVENSLEVPQKNKHLTMLQPSSPTSGYIFKGNEISISKRYLPSHIYAALLRVAGCGHNPYAL